MPDLSSLAVGLVGEAQFIVTPDRLAPAVGSGSAQVFATPMLVALMEAAAVDCVERHLPADHQSLGVHIGVTHNSPTPAGHTVTATAELVAIEGRKLTFKVVARDATEQIGQGSHTRVVVDTPRFLARLAAKDTTSP